MYWWEESPAYYLFYPPQVLQPFEKKLAQVTEDVYKVAVKHKEINFSSKELA